MAEDQESGLTERRTSVLIYGTKLFDTLIVFLKDFFEKDSFEKKKNSADDIKSIEITQHTKSKNHIYIGPRTPCAERSGSFGIVLPRSNDHVYICLFVNI